MNILYAFLIITVLGLILGFGLAFAAKKLEIKKDEKLVELEKNMPGANCGGCGFAGCSAYALAVREGRAEVGLCAPGGAALAKKMAEIMGVTVETDEMRRYPVVFCRSSCKDSIRNFDYQGITDCNALAMQFGGDAACTSGCLHLGSCIKVCPVGALSFDSNGDIAVDRKKCISCGKCEAICPHHVIRLVDENVEYVVACNSHENGAKVRKACSVGCIGCRICQTKFPDSGCTVENFLSSFEQNRGHSQIQEAMEACPVGCIIRRK